MHKKKDVLTTGQVAQICNVAPRTVTKWFDSGQLKGYRIPGSRDRRIPTNELVRFMKAHDIPTDGLDIGTLRILILDSNTSRAESQAQSLRDKRDYEVHTAFNSFDAGLFAQKMLPHVILINLMAREIDASQVCRYVRSNSDLSGTKVVAVAHNLKASEAQALQQKGFDEVITDAEDVNHAIAAIEQVTAIIY
ncbi:MAG: helix-turn-helix domain-containing protein [Sedimentisphaerales bacterium]|nr:helix-turn-helix domain-containing protein [Sedimentisphaerales bacterium]